ncbi:hypothetical protein HBN50_15950 [Halobacteriovorax sp. GB3]|uniref:hypothetical protein n=1 Tax=Halobacteriovorax sp. GB3 TaxID=2719615 RepID=UPI00235E7EEE|nr:hypothetical protein [Halobacteriovorax sp. GB3]MDD0854606.1 hypothetical protein [Halobacteriovorax sp. GB3]
MMNSDIDHYKSNDLLSWMYLRFNTITDLTPKFYEPYLYGGIYLSIIKDDDLGAKKIYEKGINQFPNDYYLLLNSSFHYYYELGDVDNAITNLTKIKDHPRAASYIPSLIARLKSSSGDLVGAFTLLYETFRNAPSESAIKKKLANDLYSIKAEIDLDCLNSESNKTCQRQDFFGNDYIYMNGRYSSSKPFKPYRNKKGAN